MASNNLKSWYAVCKISHRYLANTPDLIELTTSPKEIAIFKGRNAFYKHGAFSHLTRKQLNDFYELKEYFPNY